MPRDEARSRLPRHSRTAVQSTISSIPCSTTTSVPDFIAERPLRRDVAPAAADLQVIPTYVPRVNADGNETSGVPSVLHQAPLGTYLGWNVTASDSSRDRAAASAAATGRSRRRRPNGRRTAIRDRRSRSATARSTATSASSSARPSRRSGDRFLLAGRCRSADSTRRRRAASCRQARRVAGTPSPRPCACAAREAHDDSRSHHRLDRRHRRYLLQRRRTELNIVGSTCEQLAALTIPDVKVVSAELVAAGSFSATPGGRGFTVPSFCRVALRPVRRATRRSRSRSGCRAQRPGIASSSAPTTAVSRVRSITRRWHRRSRAATRPSAPTPATPAISWNSAAAIRRS